MRSEYDNDISIHEMTQEKEEQKKKLDFSGNQKENITRILSIS